MADLTPIPALDGVYQLETNDLALAGSSPGQVMNRQAQALLNRDAYRGQEIEAVSNSVTTLRQDLITPAVQAAANFTAGATASLQWQAEIKEI
jgi:hypothetical protein